GVAARARGVDRAGGRVLEERLGDLRAGAVAGAQEQHSSPARPPDRMGRRGSRCEPERGVQCSAGRLKLLLATSEVDRVVAVTSVRGAATRGDEPALAQATQVVGDKVLRLPEAFGQLPYRAITEGQLPQKLPPEGMRHEPHEAGRILDP